MWIDPSKMWDGKKQARARSVGLAGWALWMQWVVGAVGEGVGTCTCTCALALGTGMRWLFLAWREDGGVRATERG